MYAVVQSVRLLDGCMIVVAAPCARDDGLLWFPFGPCK